MFRRLRGQQPARPEPATSTHSPTPTDTCVRCGRPTPPGVSLCRLDNPGGVAAPSSTQMHGTIAVGILGGILIVFLGAQFVVGRSGPFETAVRNAQVRGDGSVEVSVDVTNRGEGQAAATCRIQRGNTALASDATFRTGPLQPNETRPYVQLTGVPAADEDPYDPARLRVSCR